MAPGPILSGQYHCNRCEYDIPKVWLKNIVGFHAISAAYYWVVCHGVMSCDRGCIQLCPIHRVRKVAKTSESMIE